MGLGRGDPRDGRGRFTLAWFALNIVRLVGLAAITWTAVVHLQLLAKLVVIGVFGDVTR